MRPGTGAPSPYVAPPSLHVGALRIAAAAPAFALLILFGACSF